MSLLASSAEGYYFPTAVTSGPGPMPDTITSSPCLHGERVTFTGTLASMTHKEAADLVAKNGGTAVSSVSGQTTMLVVGDEGWPLEADGQTSQKLELAEQQISTGANLRIISESDWLHLLELADRDAVHRAYTPAMLSQLLGVSVNSIRRWERLGLIRAVRKVHRLPYFDFTEVANARRMSELLLQGVSPEQLQSSLAKISRSLPGTDRPLEQLNLLVQDSELILRDERGIMEAVSGQRLLDFDTNPTELSSESVSVPLPDDEDGPVRLPVPEDNRVDWSADEWFYEGCRLSDCIEHEAAVEAFRMSLMTLGHEARQGRQVRRDACGDDPHPAEISFHLADALYCCGKTTAALERYYSAVEHDPHYLEAWIQLGCLLEEQGTTDRALDAFRIALDVHPDYPDANLHIANAYERIGDLISAREHWSRYLQFDSRGPWAEHARARLAQTDAVTG